MARQRKLFSRKLSDNKQRKNNRRLLQEALEPRMLMDASGPRLIGVNPDAGRLFSFINLAQNQLSTAPSELTLRFDPGRTVDPFTQAETASQIDPDSLQAGVSVRYSRDPIFGNADDQFLVPGFLGADDQGRVVTFRFGENLADGFYRIDVDSDLVNEGGLTATSQTVDFQLALGAKIISVVPQPVRRDANGLLVQQRNQIEVYFNDDDLQPSLAENPAFYRLLLTQDTVRNTDDVVFNPTTVIYDPALDRAILTFSNDLATLAGGAGTFRLRVGNLEPQPLAPRELPMGTDAGSSFTTARAISADFDTGALLLVASNGSGNSLSDGGRFSVEVVADPTRPDVTQTRFFVLDNTNVPGTPANLPPGAVTIPFTPTQSALTVATNIASQLSIGVGITATARATSTGAEISIAGDRGVLVSLGTTGLSLGTRGLVLSGNISNQGQRYPLTWEGASTEPGQRENLLAPSLLSRADTVDGVTTLYYNFNLTYDGNRNNPITPPQRQRFREVFSLISNVIGVQFVETADRGFQLVTGDLRAIDQTIDTGAGGPLLAFRVNDDDPSRGLLVLDGGENWNDSFGFSNTPGNPSYFETAMRGVLNMLGVGDSFDLPPGETIAGSIAAPVGPLTPNTFNSLSGPIVLRRANAVEPDYPGDIETVRAQHLYRPESKDIDLYQFDVQQAGVLTAETFAERLPAGSLLNATISLWRENADGTRTKIARNDDYFGNDAFVELSLQPGRYFIGVSAAGNEDFNPAVNDSGIGGTTEGAYQLRLGFRPDVALAIRDTDNGIAGGTAFDGDGDGIPGGAYDFWFRTAPEATPANVGTPRTLFVDKSFGGSAQGTRAAPFSNVNTALQAARVGDIVRIVGNSGDDGRADTLNDNLAYQFGAPVATDSSVRDGASFEVPAGVTVMIDAGSILKFRQTRVGVGSSDPAVDRSGAALQVLGTPYLSDLSGAALRVAASARTSFGGPANVRLELTARTAGAAGNALSLRIIIDPLAAAAPLVRLSTLNPREIEVVTSSPQTITFQALANAINAVPAVTALVQASTLVTGGANAATTFLLPQPTTFVSLSGGLDRVNGSVFFTSYEDESIGRDTNTLTTSPSRGQWGGIEFQNDVDISRGRERLEREGIFLNYVNHADMRFGGGSVVVDGNARVIRPVQMIDSRPTVTYNRITQSQNAAISASPNSFTEDNFNDPVSALPGSTATQRFPFTSDIRRNGPNIDSNSISQNTFNGLFVDIVTPAGNAQRPLTTSARWDDTDIVHIVTANLNIQGQPGGALFVETAPAVTTVTSTFVAGGNLPIGTYTYRLTNVTARGQESPASQATNAITTTAVGSVRLANLPAATGEFVSRNLYRSQADGSWILVRRLDASTAVFTDNGRDDGGLLRRNTPVAGAVALAPQAGGRLAPGTYDYRFIYDLGAGAKSEASLPTRSLTISGNPTVGNGPGNGRIVLSSLPAIPAGQKLEIYRRDPATGNYLQVASVDPGTTSYTDVGPAVGVVINSEVEPNDSIATAQDLDAAEWLQTANPVIANSTTRPYLSIFGTGNETFDYYSFTATAGSQGTFDIDGANFDTELFLFDPAGNPVAQNDDSSLDPGSSTSTDSFITFTFPVTGRYTLGVGKFSSFFSGGAIAGATPATGDFYQLQISVDGKTTVSVENLPVMPISALGVELARSSGRLSIDPAVVVKVDGSRIETTFGGDLYAEAVEGREIIFTSLLDDNYGRGGTFDTTNNGTSFAPAPGNWSGLYFGQLSDGGLDNVRVSYAGGLSQIGGAFAGFNAVEIHQADVRIARSTFSDNAAGLGGQLGVPDTGVSAVNPVGNPATRAGRGFNAAGTIFVRGAQPTIVENVIRDGQGAAININANAMVDRVVVDPGRAVGVLAARGSDLGNRGPLIRDNLLGGNALDGMAVRSETLTTSTVWDDTDITHLVAGEVIVPDFQFEGGLTLASRPGESLVVKLSGNTAGFTTLGRPLDIDDRIGGAIHLAGQPGFPVILTSLRDDSVGAGFGFDGNGLTDTDGVNGAGNQVPAQAGDWRGIRLEEYTHDRNVALVNETERFDTALPGPNDLPTSAQYLGFLAAHEKASDESLRLGYQVNGLIAGRGDIDVYSFEATAGTEVWLDIDRTAVGLDSVVELIDGQGNLLAISDNSYFEERNPAVRPGSGLSVVARPLAKNGNTPDLDTTNPKDAGMRVVLHGAVGTRQLYYVRVRSSSVDVDPTSASADRSRLTDASRTRDGLSAGRYQLNIRLRETDEVPGASLSLADIRFATTGVTILGGPTHSPLAGEGAEIIDANGNDGNSTLAGSYNLGNLNQSDRAALSARGSIDAGVIVGSPNPLGDDVDFFRFFVQPPALPTPRDAPDSFYTPVTIDVDYADAFGRANTAIALFDSLGRLIAIGSDSNVADDQGPPVLNSANANDKARTDLSAGSIGQLDPLIGPIMLLSDGPSSTGLTGTGQTDVVAEQGTIQGRWYSAAVHSVATVPSVLDQFWDPNSSNPNVRLIPNESVRVIVSEDFRDEFLSGTSNVPSPSNSSSSDFRYTADQPVVENPIVDNGYNGAVPFDLMDMTLYVSLDQGISGNNQSSLISVNPYTGSRIATLGQWGDSVGDLAMRRDGELFSIGHFPPSGGVNQGTVGNFINIDPSTASTTIGSDGGDDGLATPGLNNDPSLFLFNAITFQRVSSTVPSAITDGERFFGVANRNISIANPSGSTVFQNNIMYSMVANSGAATNQGSTNAQLDRGAPAAGVDRQGAGTNKRELGIIDTTRGEPADPFGNFNERTITGIAQDPSASNRFYAVDEEGGLYTFTTFSFQPADPVGFNEGRGGTVFNTTFLGVVADVTSPTSNGFAGLTFGPRDAGATTPFSAGPYRDTLFAVTADGVLHAFDKLGRSQKVFSGGRSQIAIDQLTFNIPGGSDFGVVTGLAFSTLERNLWHTTFDRADNSAPEIGHGVFDTPTESRSRSGTTGGQSFYFGVEVSADDTENIIDRAPGTVGRLTPGGATGSLITKSMDLSEYAPGDKPMLYFNYRLETDGVDYDDDGNDFSYMQDAFRVYGTGDDGVWRLLATNNSFRNPLEPDEFDYSSVNGTIVQELFDNRNQWRQARIDLSPFAGNENFRIQFEFATGGGTDFHNGPGGDSGLVADRVELVGVRGSRITDGDTISLTDDGVFGNLFGGPGAADSRTQVFEFDSGFTLTFPEGTSISPNQTLTLSRTDATGLVTPTVFEFVTSPFSPLTLPTNVRVVYQTTDTGAAIAASVAQAINTQFQDFTLRTALQNVSGASLQLNFTQGSQVVLEQGLGSITLVSNVLTIPPAQQLVNGETLLLRRGLETQRIAFRESVTPLGPNDRVVPFDQNLDTPNDLASSAAQAMGFFLDGTGATGNSITLDPSTNLASVPTDFVYTGGILEFVDGSGLVEDEALVIRQGNNVSRVIFDNNASPNNLIRRVLRYDDLDSQNAIGSRTAALINPFFLHSNPAGNLNPNQFQLAPGVTVFSSPGLFVQSGAVATGLIISTPSGSLLSESEEFTIRRVVPGGFAEQRIYLDDTGVDAQSISVVSYDALTPANTIVGSIAAELGPLATAVGSRLSLAPGVELVQRPASVTMFGGTLQFPSAQQVPSGTRITVTRSGETRSFVFQTNTLPQLETRVFFDAATDTADAIAQRIGVAVGSEMATVTLNSVQLVPNAIVTLPVPAGLTYDSIANSITVTDLSQLQDTDILEIEVNGVIQRLELDRTGNIDSTQVTLLSFNTTVDTQADIVDRFDLALADYGNGVTFVNGRFSLALASDVELLSAPAGYTQQNAGNINNSLLFPFNLAPVDGQFFIFRRGSTVRRIELNDDVIDPTRTRAVETVIDFSRSQSASTIAQEIFNAIGDFGANLNGSAITLRNAAPNQLDVIAPANVFVAGDAGVEAGNIPVYVHAGMTAIQVAQSITQSLTQGFGGNASTYKRFEERIQLPRFIVNDQGPLGAQIGGKQGNEFGELGRSRTLSLVNNDSERGNDVEGVYIDDIVIGFAERGELVLNAPVNSAFTSNPDVREVLRGVNIDEEEAPQPERPFEIVTGAYQVEIRTSATYGVPWETTDIVPNLALDNSGSIYASQAGRSFDTNDRLSNAVTLAVAEPSTYRSGDTFVLSDGTHSMTFEFVNQRAGAQPRQGNVPIFFDLVTDTRNTLAAKVRDAINSDEAQEAIDIRARSVDSQLTGVTGSHRIDLFGETVLLNPTIGQNLFVDLISQEILTPPTPFRISGTDALARAVPTSYQSGQRDSMLVVGRLGDRPILWDQTEELPPPVIDDRDFIRIHLNAGDRIDLDIDAVSAVPYQAGIAPQITVYNAQGESLLTNLSDLFSARPDDATGEAAQGDGFLQFLAPFTGDYIIELKIDQTLINPGGNQPRDNFLINANNSPTFNREIDDYVTDYNFWIRPAGGPRDVVAIDLHRDTGDKNRFRDQGQIIVNGVTVRESANFGIDIQPGRGVLPGFGDLMGNLPRPGAAAQLRNPNNQRLLPGPVLVNNVLDSNGAGGISIAGGTAGDDPTMFVRVVNNTIYGNDLGIGVSVTGNASPTLLNNVLLSNLVGIQLANTPAAQTSVLGSNLYSRNGSALVGGTLGAFDFNLDTNPTFNQQVVVDAAGGNFLPSQGSLAIDSGQDTLDDRNTFVITVKQPVGIAESPILSPKTDALGLERVDGETQSPIAQGSNAFVDRGAIDRADTSPPESIIINPADNDAAGLDVNRDITEILYRNPSGQGLRVMEIRITEDSGTGPDPASVIPGNLVLLQNGTPLVEGSDYTFGYNPSSRTIRLTPAAGLFSPFTVYDVILNNGQRPVDPVTGVSLLRPEFLTDPTDPTSPLRQPIRDLVQLPLVSNRTTLETRYTIVIQSRPPRVVDDVVMGLEDGAPIAANVLSNDFDPDGGTITVGNPISPRDVFVDVPGPQGTTSVLAGTVELQTDGDFVFTPAPNFFTPVGQPLLFTYVAVDSDGASSVRLASDGSVSAGPATITVMVNSVNDRPVNNPDGPYDMLEDESFLIPVSQLTANDSPGAPFEQGQILSIIPGTVAAVNDSTIGAPITAALVTVNGQQFVQISPQQHANGLAKFVYRIQDDGGTTNGGISEAATFATVTLNILPVNDAPVPDENAHAARNFQVMEDTTLPLVISVPTILAADNPGPNRVSEKAIDELPGSPVVQTLIFESIEATTDNGGTVEWDRTTNELRYTPRANFFGTDAIFYTIRDTRPNDLAPDNWVLVGPGRTFANQPVSRTARGRITLTVNPVNDPPSVDVARTRFEMLEDTTLVVSGILNRLAANAGPNESEQLLLSPLNLPTPNGNVTLTPTSSGNDYNLTYVPNASFFGVDTFTLTLLDVPGSGQVQQSTLVSLTMTVRPVNDAPIAVNDTIHILEDVVAEIPAILVTVNDRVDPFSPGSTAGEDRDVAGNTPQTSVRITNAVSAGTNPAGTSVSIANGNIRVTPPNNFFTRSHQIVNGGYARVAPPLQIIYTITDDGESYSMQDGSLTNGPDSKSATGTILVDVWPTNDAPVGRHHTFLNVIEDTPFTIHAGVVPPPSVPPTTPIPNLFLTPADLIAGQPPNSSKDSAGILEDVGPSGVYNANLGLLQTLNLVAPDPLNPNQLEIGTLRGGTVRFVPAAFPNPGFNQLIYTPPENFASKIPLDLVDTVTYRVADNGVSFQLLTGGTASLAEPTPVSDSLTSSGTITFSVNPVNDPPEFSIRGDLSVQEDENRPSFGAVSGQPNFLSIAGFARDIRKGPPTAIDEESQQVAFVLDVANTALFQTLNGRPDVRILPDGTLQARLAQDANGSTEITVTAYDDFARDPVTGLIDLEATGKFPRVPPDSPIKFTFTVTPVNDAPVIQTAPGLGSTPTITIDEDAGLQEIPVISQARPGPVTAIDENKPIAEGGQTVTLSATLVSPSQSSLFEPLPTISADGILRFRFKPNTSTANVGPVLIRVEAVDTGLETPPNVRQSVPVTITLNVTEINDPPIPRNDPADAVSGRYTTSEDQPLRLDPLGLLINDTDPEGSAVTVVGLGASGGMAGLSNLGAGVLLGVNGSVNYDATGLAQVQQLTTGETLQDFFTYRITDGVLESTTLGTVTITITGVNDAPVISPANVRVSGDRPTVIDLLQFVTDVDSGIDPATIRITSDPIRGTLEVRLNGTIVYSPVVGFRGIDQFTMTIDDVQGGRSAPVTITLNATDIPLGVADVGRTFRNNPNPVRIDILGNDLPAATPLNPATVQIVTDAGNGVVTINPDGSVNYIPATNFLGTDEFFYTVRDSGVGGGQPTDPTRVTVSVAGSAGQNSRLNADVNNSGEVSPIDVLLIINHLNNGGNPDVNALFASGVINLVSGPFLDVNGNGVVEPLDALLVINILNSRTGGGLGEADVPAQLASTTTTLAAAHDSAVLEFALDSNVPTTHAWQTVAQGASQEDDLEWLPIDEQADNDGEEKLAIEDYFANFTLD